MAPPSCVQPAWRLSEVMRNLLLGTPLPRVISRRRVHQPSIMSEANTRLYRSQECFGENSAPSTTAHFISVLERGLTTACSTTRAPDNFDAFLEAACSEIESSLSRGFLRAGFQVWFAYFLAFQEGNVRGLDQLSPADLTHVTSQITRVVPHESVRQLFSYLFQGWRGRKRQGE